MNTIRRRNKQQNKSSKIRKRNKPPWAEERIKEVVPPNWTLEKIWGTHTHKNNYKFVSLSRWICKFCGALENSHENTINTCGGRNSPTDCCVPSSPWNTKFTIKCFRFYYFNCMVATSCCCTPEHLVLHPCLFYCGFHWWCHPWL